MTNALTPISRAEKALAAATTPEQTKNVEAMAAAARAWAKEQNDFEKVVMAWEIYVKARRKTAELIMPKIQWGGDRGGNQYDKWQGDDDVTLADFNLTKKQWSRRKKELEVAPEEIGEYIDECIEKGVEPTISGLLRTYTQIIGDTTGDEWWTPRQYIESVHAVMGGVDLDPASCPEANAVVKAATYFTELDNGLAHEWRGRVFMNPPYSQNKPFAEKMLSEYGRGSVKQAIILLGAHAIETKWFAPYWDYVLCFTGHRIKFNTPGGPAIAGNISGSVFIYLPGDRDPIKFAQEFGKHGYVVKRWPF